VQVAQSTATGGGPARWRALQERLAARGSTLTAAELDALADALFWLDRPDDSTAARHRAYTAHLAGGDLGPATLAAWRLFYDHFLVGELAPASGWLERARRHATGRHGSVEAGFLAVADADWALHGGDARTGLGHARRAVAAGHATAVPDLVAMGLMVEGRMLIALGRVPEGVARLDEAMVSVVNGELDPLFTGWVYCAVLSMCRDLADLRRAGEWTDAAMRWCDDLREGLLYPGTCRIHRVELACLRGAWATAEDEARRACDELNAHDPRYAGDAFYMAGEVRRLRGDLAGAERAFDRAGELGRHPQPGLARVRLAQGQAGAAAGALRLALRPGPAAPLARSLILAALAEAEIAVGDVAAAGEAAAELVAVADRSSSPYLVALAALAAGHVRLAGGDAPGALVPLGRAASGFASLGLPYETAQAREAAGTAAVAMGDRDTARFELGAACDGYRRLGATTDADRVEARLADARPGPADPAAAGARPSGRRLTDREVEVVRLVAKGKTNREIGTLLSISEHTVARHLSNVFAKLGVASRAAATACAYERGLV
jgi:DNA-binding CsgD family transcriptional regulator